LAGGASGGSIFDEMKPGRVDPFVATAQNKSRPEEERLSS